MELRRLIDKETSRQKTDELFERWNTNLQRSFKIYSEQDTATKWIKPLLSCLGWNIYDIDEVKEGVKLDLSSGEQRFLDCVLYTDNTPYIVMEFKRVGIGYLHNRKSTIEKLRLNAKQAGAKYAVFTRFHETTVYDAITGEEKAYFRGSDDYRKNFETLWSFLANPSIKSKT